jgi:hypothetical protein
MSTSRTVFRLWGSNYPGTAFVVKLSIFPKISNVPIPDCVGINASLTTVLVDWTEMVLLVCVKAGVGVTGEKYHILDYDK